MGTQEKTRHLRTTFSITGTLKHSAVFLPKEKHESMRAEKYKGVTDTTRELLNLVLTLTIFYKMGRHSDITLLSERQLKLSFIL
jgi:hypothetical protein